MGIRTEQQYWNSIRKQKPEVYVMGERVENIIDHPLIKGSASGAALTFCYANDPPYRDLFTIQSPLVNEPVNRYVSVHNNIQDLMDKVKLIRFVARRPGSAPSAAWGGMR
jgi:4-hydroxybutyryl-CoA dehydratase/vinylacetyl-CoA-Delta-isomerase